ncbi:hypothetical protein ASPCAL10156 [Aspergillus calidoustus]|uniref:Uncharacterized protein n=1 Tax=Aspergillus calidoustus TaxID=454130 RepID=A0A0U5G7R8_ASPCI|nr:hypothetical protein ASPCAL10156 [Aspergillus calidoustus]
MSAPAPPSDPSNNGGGNNAPTEKDKNTSKDTAQSQSQSQPKDGGGPKEKNPPAPKNDKSKTKEKDTPQSESESESESGSGSSSSSDSDSESSSSESESEPEPAAECSNKKCLKLKSFCKPCLEAATKICSSIPHSQIESRAGWFPITVTVHVTGTQQEIQTWVWKQISRLHLFYPTRTLRWSKLRGEHKHPRVRVCAVERARDASAGGGNFADFTDLTSPTPGMLSVQEVSWQETTKVFAKKAARNAGGGMGSEEAQARRMARAKLPWWAKERARSAEREVLMLVDFPDEIKEEDEVLKLYLGGFGKRFEVVEVKFPGPETTWNAHRLAWWVYTHPAQNGDRGISVDFLKAARKARKARKAKKAEKERKAREARKRRSRSRSASQPQQQQPQQQQWQQPQQQQPQQTQWFQLRPAPIAWVTPISVDPNYFPTPPPQTPRLPTAREASRMKTKTPRWMKSIAFKP